MLLSHLTLSFHMYSSNQDFIIVIPKYQLPTTKLHSLQKEAVDTKMYFPNSPEYKLVAIVLDVAKFSLYKPVQSVSPEETHTRAFLKFDFRNKGIDALNISKILNRQKVTSTTPAYSKLQSSSSSYFYSYSCPIASKNFQLQKKKKKKKKKKKRKKKKTFSLETPQRVSAKPLL